MTALSIQWDSHPARTDQRGGSSSSNRPDNELYRFGRGLGDHLQAHQQGHHVSWAMIVQVTLSLV